MPPWSAVKTKVQLRISVQRLRILQEKKEAQAKAARRDIASLLEGGKLEKARVKVESIISEDIHVELLELLELYCELLLARFSLLEQNTREPDPGISEAVCNIIHAAPRTEVKELQVLRDQLMQKYGRDFSLGVMENRNSCVSDRVLKKINVGTPSAQLVDGYLAEIARGYGIHWEPPSAALSEELTASSTSDVDDSDKILKGTAEQHSTQAVADVEKGISGITLTNKSMRVGDGDIPKLPDLPPTEGEPQGGSGNIDKIGGAAQKDKIEGGSGKTSAPSSASGPSEDDEFALLAKRFEALKRR